MEMMEMEGQQVEKKYPLANPLIVLIDKNSLWGGSDVQKRESCVKGILAQNLWFVGGPFQREFGGISE